MSVTEVGSRFFRSDHPHLDGHQALNSMGAAQESLKS